jgi:hypothetical protein
MDVDKIWGTFIPVPVMFSSKTRVLVSTFRYWSLTELLHLVIVIDQRDVLYFFFCVCRYAPDFVESRRVTITDLVERGLKKGKGAESVAAARLALLLAMQLDDCEDVSSK